MACLVLVVVYRFPVWRIVLLNGVILKPDALRDVDNLHATQIPVSIADPHFLCSPRKNVPM